MADIARLHSGLDTAEKVIALVGGCRFGMYNASTHEVLIPDWSCGMDEPVPESERIPGMSYDDERDGHRCLNGIMTATVDLAGWVEWYDAHTSPDGWKWYECDDESVARRMWHEALGNEAMLSISAYALETIPAPMCVGGMGFFELSAGDGDFFDEVAECQDWVVDTPDNALSLLGR